MQFPSHVVFADERLRKEFFRLATGDAAERELYRALLRAFARLTTDARHGTQVRKHLIPDEYARNGVTNLWKCDLPRGWRLLYSIAEKKIVVLSIILEWLDHKEYERRLKY